MPPLADLAANPPAADPAFAPWFAALADHLLNRTDLLVAGRPHRLAELEAYYHGPAHPDPFTHRDPLQRLAGRWYFHRTGGAYRGGSFKGVDLTLGDGTATFGMLVRTVVAPDGTVIAGPSRIVDHLLQQTGCRTVAELDARIAGRPAWDATSPLAIRDAESPRTADVLATARVGLSLRRGGGKPGATQYVMRPYRYLTDPRRVTKGRPQTVLALQQVGHDAAAIHALTGVPRRTIDRYLADFAAGRSAADFSEYVGKDLSTSELCRLIGTWAAKYGAAGLTTPPPTSNG